jgi:ankyrin repeat protein
MNELACASQNGNLKEVIKLIDSNADIHVTQDWPLRIAVENGHLDVVNKLIESNADVHAINDEALTAAVEII